MRPQTDIFFDAEESGFMLNRHIFPLKRQINRKLYILFEQIKNQIKDTAIHRQFPFPEGTDIQTGKISKGENKDQYPWVLLDFPKLFQRNRIFAYRSLFWYGHGFSNSLVVGGAPCDTFFPVWLRSINRFEKSSVRFSIATHPWDLSTDQNEVNLTADIDPEIFSRHVSEHHFFKLTATYWSDRGEELIHQTLLNYELMTGSLL
jgi:hypothetical protein